MKLSVKLTFFSKWISTLIIYITSMINHLKENKLTFVKTFVARVLQYNLCYRTFFF